MRRPLILAAASVLALTSISSAEGTDPDWYGGIIGKDDRQFIETTEAPWGAIGQVNVSGASSLVYCTGTLVAEKLVLTAAHCLVNFRNHKPYTPETVHFVAGVRRDKHLGHSVAKCLLFPKEYNPVVSEKNLPGRTLVPREAFASDIAAIVLADPIATAPVPVRVTDFEEGLPLMFGGYMADHRYMLAADKDCELISINEGQWITTCDTHGGGSGGPMFVKQGDETFLAAVMVGTVSHVASLAVPVSTWKDLPLEGVCP